MRRPSTTSWPRPRPAWWRTTGEGLTGLLLDSRCAGCDDAPGLWCPGCAATTAPRVVTRVLGVPVAAAADYEGPAGRAVVAHKERSRVALARPLGHLLAAAVAALAVADVEHLVPVPSRRSTVRQRGHDHALRTARSAARELRRGGADLRVVPGLQLVRAVGDQAELPAALRHLNLDGAVAATGRGRRVLRGARVVVVDDVMTTGSTLRAAVSAAQLVGAEVVGCAVVVTVTRWAPTALPPPSMLG